MQRKKYNASFKFRIFKDLCHFKFDDAYLAIILKYRISVFKLYLNKLGINCKLLQQYRSKKIAHRWSTAYQIANGGITLGDLRRLKDGIDEDGNIWYKRDWDPGGSDDEYARISKPIVTNAIKLGQAKMHYAEESYETNSLRRDPNIKSIPVSRHVYGQAIDFRIDWSQLGGPWSLKAEQIISQFGLLRPHGQEYWHFELDKNEKSRTPFIFQLN